MVGGLLVGSAISTSAAATASTASAAAVCCFRRGFEFSGLFGGRDGLFLGSFFFAGRPDGGVSAAADFDGAFCGGVFQHHAGFAKLEDFIVAHGNEE
jgi:hypothetical protein